MTTQFYQLPKPADRKGFGSLELKSAPIPEVGPNEVLVNVKACSLNYRDLIISLNQYPLHLQDAPTIPLSDGAGIITQVGSNVTKWKKEDRVMSIFNQIHLKGTAPNAKEFKSALGGSVDGMLSQYRVLPADSLVRIPSHLSYEEAATLPCAAVTSWNALFGIQPLKPGQLVLAEGTGGVSVFAAQFAVHSGSHCLITSSSDEKLEIVKKSIPTHLQHLLHTVNYKKNPDWDKEALRLSKEISNGEEEIIGVDHCVEVGGPGTLEKAFACIKRGGVVSDIGFVAQGEVPNIPVLALSTSAIYRGVLVGSLEQFEDMNRLIQSQQIKPVIDKVFEFKDAQKAYEHQWSASHTGKVVIRI